MSWLGAWAPVPLESPHVPSSGHRRLARRRCDPERTSSLLLSLVTWMTRPGPTSINNRRRSRLQEKRDTVGLGRGMAPTYVLIVTRFINIVKTNLRGVPSIGRNRMAGRGRADGGRPESRHAGARHRRKSRKAEEPRRSSTPARQVVCTQRIKHTYKEVGSGQSRYVCMGWKPHQSESLPIDRASISSPDIRKSLLSSFVYN